LTIAPAKVSVCIVCIHNDANQITMPETYYVLLVCRVCLRSQWLRLEKLELDANDLLNMYWKFECPVHGMQYERPFQVDEASPCLQSLRDHES
jgi:hypothetical protein